MADDKIDYSWSWQENIAILAAIGSVSLVAMRLLIVAGGDPETAYVILQNQGTGAVVVGSLVSVIGLAVTPIGLVMIWYSYKHWVPNKDFLTPRFSLAGGLLLVTVAFFTAPAMELVVTVGLALLSGVGMGMFRRHAYRYKDGSKKSFRFDMATALAACCVSIVALGLISPNPWLPSEKIITKSMQPFTGYILSQANGEVAVLTYNPVGVIQLPQSEIKEILACMTSGYILHEATFLELIDTGRDLPYQSCPAKVKVPKAQRGDNTYVNRQDVRHRLAGADDTLIPRG